MKRTSLYILLLVLCGFACKKRKVGKNQITELKIQSQYTGSSYDVWVVVPKNYNSDLHYETVYLLDANQFYLKHNKIAKLTQDLSNKYNKQNAIVVGISSKHNRDRDFTPTATDYGSGGCENYAKFIIAELIPKIEQDFSVDTASKSRIIIGHSYGGLLACYFFTKHPAIFKNYIMLSPSLWYDNSVMLKYETESGTINMAYKNLVFIGCGEFEEDIVVRSQELNYRLSQFYSNTTLRYNKIPNRYHVSSAFENAEKGLVFYYQHK